MSRKKHLDINEIFLFVPHRDAVSRKANRANSFRISHPGVFLFKGGVV